jgi:hypothetical protein
MMMRSIFAAAALVVLLSGCETDEARRSATTEVLLGAAGFEIKTADKPEQKTELEALAQRQIVRHTTNGEVYYVYADAASCGCLYKGSEANYQRYRELAKSSRSRGAQSLEAIEAQPGTNPDWQIW